MRALLEAGSYFKLVCGAGNEDATEVERLAHVYTLAGATGFDVSAQPHIVDACVAGIDRAYLDARPLGVSIPNRPFITVSVGMPGDHHVRKASIDLDICVLCDLCIPACPTDAIDDAKVVESSLCIGCGLCEAACPPKVAAVRYDHNDRALERVLPECLRAGAENIELHAAVPDSDQILEEWKLVNDVNPDNFISMCLDRAHLSNFHLIERIKRATDVSGERTIIQADGIPMSGGSDDYPTTLQAIAIADIIHKELTSKQNRRYRKIHVLLSGGTNGKTGELARMCGVPYSGLSIGTHARKIVKDMISSPDFPSDRALLEKATALARDLVATTTAS